MFHRDLTSLSIDRPMPGWLNGRTRARRDYIRDIAAAEAARKGGHSDIRRLTKSRQSYAVGLAAFGSTYFHSNHVKSIASPSLQ